MRKKVIKDSLCRFERIAFATEQGIEIPAHGSCVGLLRPVWIFRPDGIWVEEQIANQLTRFSQADGKIFIFGSTLPDLLFRCCQIGESQ